MSRRVTRPGRRTRKRRALERARDMTIWRWVWRRCHTLGDNFFAFVDAMEQWPGRTGDSRATTDMLRTME